ncbi:MAG: class I SAM-dependent methyltransferase [Candidatus Omnitrophica bacterium]|nr:class I SAM-dependent methyltransferase [Candidatus Omnitrophota bacterium]
MEKTCIFCNSSEFKVVFREIKADIVRCKKCGHIFSTWNQPQDYDAYFGNTVEDINQETIFWFSDAHRLMYNQFCQRFIKKSSGRLLDFGCGLGYFLKEMSNFPQWDSWGCEISPVAVNFAKKRLGLNKIVCSKIQNLGFAKESFDIITLWDVIEYIPDPWPILYCLYNLLKPKGMLFLHTPNIHIQLPIARLTKMLFGLRKDFHYLEATDHIHHYSADTITKLLKQVEFERIVFHHFVPIQGVAGSKSKTLIFLKNLWYYSSVLLFYSSLKKINLDNLFVAAYKSA